MKHIGLTLLLLLTGLVAFAQLDRESMERARMRDNSVKRCTQFTHKYTKGKPNSQGYKTSETTYDRAGNPTMIINYRANQKESSRLYYKYDEQGRRVEYRKEETMGGKNMKVSFSQEISYDSKGNKKFEKGFDGTSNYRVVYNYLFNGKPSDITRYNSDNTVSERWIFTYSGDKQFIRVTPKNGSPYTIEKVYDKQGHLLSETQMDSGDNELKRVVYTYDKQGNLATEEQMYAGKQKYTLEYVFNDAGQLLKILQKRPNEKPFVNNNYTYDSDGNLVTEQWTDGDPNLVSQKDSEYDPKGNMVKVDSYYAPYKYRVMYSYQYEKY